MASKTIDITEVAKLVREVLKLEFPAAKFTVKSSRYSGGSSIRVNWQDGPTTKQVEDVAGFYKGASFDGMTDMKSYHHHTNEAGEQVHYGNDYIFFNRSISAEQLTPFAEYVAKHYHLETASGETVENYQYTIKGEEGEDAWVESPRNYSDSVFFGGAFGGNSFADVVHKLARNNVDFAAYMAAEAAEELERQEWLANRNKEQAAQALWDNALTEILEPAPVIEDDYVSCLRFAGWI